MIMIMIMISRNNSSKLKQKKRNKIDAILFDVWNEDLIEIVRDTIRMKQRLIESYVEHFNQISWWNVRL